MDLVKVLTGEELDVLHPTKETFLVVNETAENTTQDTTNYGTVIPYTTVIPYVIV